MTPKPSACSKGNIAFLICKSKDCSGNPFVCGNECECQVNHKYCEVRNWELIKTMFRTEKERQSRYKEIEVIHKQLLETVEKACQDFKKWKEENVSEKQKVFVEIVNSDGEKDEELTGNFIYEILAESELQKAQESMIKARHQNILKLTKSILKELEAIKYIEHLKIDSKIVKDVEAIQSFFPENLKKLKLLYRASENSFDIKKFHSACDGIPNTLLFIENEYGRILGGFTPIPWKSKQTLEKIEDPSMKSFIFSYTFRQKLQVQKYPAVCHKATDGPVFGINDLKILDKNNSGSGVFSREYNNSKNYADSQATYTLFTGKPSDGSTFKIREWEIFEVELLE